MALESLINSITDPRGSISIIDLKKNFPFEVKRCFWIFDVPHKSIRGEHAHYTCHQFLICLSGQMDLFLDNGQMQETIKLNSKHKSAYIPPLTWSAQSNFSNNSILLVFASEKYDPDEYIRSYSEFLLALRK